MTGKKKPIFPDSTDAEREAKQEVFLQAFRESGTVGAACRASGISRTQWETWKALDLRFRMAMEAADGEVSEEIEQVALNLAKTCDGKVAERTLLHMLKSRLRERYGDTKREAATPLAAGWDMKFTSPEAVSAQIIAIAHQFPTVAPTIRKTLQRILEALPV